MERVGEGVKRMGRIPVPYMLENEQQNVEEDTSGDILPKYCFDLVFSTAKFLLCTVSVVSANKLICST